MIVVIGKAKEMHIEFRILLIKNSSNFMPRNTLWLHIMF
jgi:hypothetical protein